MKKIKFLYTLTNLAGGGAEKVAVNLIRNFNREQYDFDLFLHKKEGSYLSEIPPNIKIISLLGEFKNVFVAKIVGLLSLPLLLLQIILIGKRYDLLICGLESTFVTYATIISSFIHKKPVIVTVHIDIFYNPRIKDTFHLKIIKLLYPLCSSCVCVSNGVREGLINVVPSIKDRTSVIYNPFEIETIERNGLEVVELPFTTPFVISVGRLEIQKRFDLLISAHKAVLDRGGNNSLIIVGEGSERNNLQSLIAKLELESTVKLVGFDNNPHKWVSKAHCFVLSSENEGFGNVLVEALALEIPVISSDCPSGPSEILKNGHYGMLFENLNVSELVLSIESMFNDTEKYSIFKKLAKSRADDFSAAKAISQWEILINRLTIEKNNQY